MKKSLVCFMALSFFSSPLVAQTTGAKVISLEGEAQWLSSDQGVATPLTYGARLVPGQIITTGANGKVKIKFEPDNSLITIGPASKLKITQQLYSESEKRRHIFLKLFMGKVRSLVTKVNELFDSRFEVETPNGVAGVRGTTFYVATTGATTFVATLAGESFFSPGATAGSANLNTGIRLPANFSLQIAADAPSTQNQVQPTPPTKQQEIEKQTAVYEDPQPPSAQNGATEHTAPPAWFDAAVHLPPAESPVPHAFYQQFFGHGPDTTYLAPPINQEPPGSGAGRTDVQINVHGLPRGTAN